jgi:hypothetical protein
MNNYNGSEEFWGFVVTENSQRPNSQIVFTISSTVAIKPGRLFAEMSAVNTKYYI